MARRVPAVAAPVPRDIYGYGCNQSKGHGTINPGSSFQNIGAWNSMHQDATYTLKKDDSHLRIHCQQQHSHGGTWRAGGVQMGIKKDNGVYEYLIINGSHSAIEGQHTTGNCGYSCATLNPRDYISSAASGTTLYFNMQLIQQSGGGASQWNSWDVNEERGNDGQSSNTIGGMSMFVEEFPSQYDTNQWDG